MTELDCIIQIVGGLGNQMFQYALGRRLQIQRQANVRFDLSMYKVKNDRDLTLVNFRTRAKEWSRADQITTRLSFGRTLGRAAAILKPVGHRLLWHQYEDPRKGFDPAVTQLSGRWYLRGWWHCPVYFQEIRPLLLEEFSPRHPLPPADQQMLRQISQSNAICLHVRRGDLVSHPVYSKQLKLQSADYYNSALQEMCDGLDDPQVFVFSDDPDWTRQHIRGDAPIIFMDKHDAQSDFIDLHLMSNCRHFITANSTFSWWAAWLSTHADKKVIVPPVWGYDGSGPPPQLIPADWQIGLTEHAPAAGGVS